VDLASRANGLSGGPHRPGGPSILGQPSTVRPAPDQPDGPVPDRAPDRDRNWANWIKKEQVDPWGSVSTTTS